MMSSVAVKQQYVGVSVLYAYSESFKYLDSLSDRSSLREGS